MQTTSQATELEAVGELLCRSIAARQYQQASEAVARCAALHTVDTHHAIMSILERARNIAIAQRSFASERLAAIQSADRYAPGNPDPKHYVRG